jgi:hypothetical protein
METQTEKFNLDGKEYNVSEISDAGKYLVLSLGELDQDRKKLQQKIAVLNAAEVGFVQQLREAVGDTEAQPEDIKEGEVV